MCMLGGISRVHRTGRGTHVHCERERHTPLFTVRGTHENAAWPESLRVTVLPRSELGDDTREAPARGSSAAGSKRRTGHTRARVQ